MNAASKPRLERLRWGLAGAVGLIATVMLLGWATSPAMMAGLSGWLQPMPPVSAAVGMLAAAALVAPTRAARALSAALMLSGLTLAGIALTRGPSVTSGLTTLPQPTVITSMICGGLVLSQRDTRSSWGVWALQVGALTGVLNALRALLGGLFLEDQVLLLPSASGIPPLGGLSILLLSLGMLAARPDAGWVALAVSERPAGRLLRWLVAAGIGGPIATALLTELAWRLGIFGVPVGLVLVLSGNLTVFYLVAAAYDRADQARHAAERRLAAANADLELRVAERTAALADREAQIGAIGDNLPGVMIYQSVADTGQPFHLTYLSAGVERITGYSIETVMARPALLYDQVDATSLARLRAAEEEATRTFTNLDVEVQKQTPWGLRWSRIRSRPRRLDDGRVAWDGIEMDISAQKEVEAAIERDRRYQAALFACSQVLLRPAETPAAREAAIEEALEHLITGARADRAFLMELAFPAEADGESEPFIELQAEICAPGVPPSLMSPQPLRLPLAILTPLVTEHMTPNDVIAGTVEELGARSPAFAELIAGLGVRSLIVIPLRLGEDRWCSVGFHDCTTPRVWDEQETLLLRTAAELLSATLMRWEDEDELRRREQMTATIFELMPVGVVILDPAGRPVRLNAAIGRIAGLDLATISQGGYERLRYIHPDGRPISPPEYASTRALAGEEVRDFEYGLIRPDGTLYWLSSSATPLALPGMAAALIVVDITARKQAEAERLSFERKLLEAQRMESLGVLAGGVAHDFNNILATILGHAELARFDLDPASDAVASLEAIALGARRAADLTGQMLAYAGRSHFVSEAVDLNIVTRELSELTRATLPGGVSVAQRLDPGLPPVVADGTQVRQVLLNLLTNAGEAIQASAAGGTIVVATGRCELSAEGLAEATISAGTPGWYGYIEVSDTGGGIDAATMTRIFEPFFTTKFTGRGLGLAAVQGIIGAHHGALFVRSVPGQGATFRACFPLAPETSPG